MTVTHIEEVELSIEQRALAVENIKLDCKLITEAILSHGTGLGRGWLLTATKTRRNKLSRAKIGLRRCSP